MAIQQVQANLYFDCREIIIKSILMKKKIKRRRRRRKKKIRDNK